MPLYEFENAERGIAVEVHLPVAELVDTIMLTRRTVPRSVGTPLATPPSQERSVLAGYSALEDAGKLRGSRYTPEQIKAAWAADDKTED